MPSSIKVTVYESAIQSHFESGGIVHGEMNDIGREGLRYARSFAPVRTGNLRKSILGGAPLPGRLSGTVTIYATATYGKWVELGTGPVIFPKRGPFLLVPVSKGASLRMRRGWVRGQEGQHFMEDGMNMALTRRGYPAAVTGQTVVRLGKG